MRARPWVLPAILVSMVVVGVGATVALLWSMTHCRPGLAGTRDPGTRSAGIEVGGDPTTVPAGTEQPLMYLPLVLRSSPGGPPPATANAAPVVDAGASQTVTLPLPALLDGTVSDDGLPDPPAAVTTTWSRASGPGPVTFADPHALDTRANFTIAGTYALRLAADDGALSSADTVTVTVLPSATVLVGAGDIAGCGHQKDEETAKQLGGIDGTVFTLGDNVYPDGTAAQFANCYDPTWGQFRDRTRPTPGNHDYHILGAAGYFGYFGAAAGDADKGYYSYDAGDWHVIVLNSRCSAVGGCGADSPQGQWLQADLAAHPSTCTLAYWHVPLFSSGSHHGGKATRRDFWQILYDAGADVVLNGHEHNYERFSLQDPDGRADPERGIRQFVVGTGGGGLYAFGPAQPNSEARNDDTYGVLALTLYPDSYDWTFIPVDGGTFTDTGHAACVTASPVAESAATPAPR
jgi:hypothetical protein